VTVRTLHHYDQIASLEPSSIGTNGYRYYGEEALYRLQQILFYRELDMPLKQINRIVTRRDFDILAALRSHRSALDAEATRIRRLIRTIDVTTQHLKGEAAMSDKQLFGSFGDAEQQEMAEEAARRWDSETVRASNAQWNRYPAEKKQRIMQEGNALYMDLIEAMTQGAASPEVQAIIARWHTHLQYFWSPNDEQLLGLADLYNEDPRFRANYEAMKPGLAEFMRGAVQMYVKNRKKATR